jgi:putative FmdB family regulatory protein
VPLYEYQCLPLKHRFEVRQGFSDEPVSACPECGGPVRRVIHPAGIVFKGSGFYATDSRSSKSAASKSEKKAESADKTEAKSESTSETKSESKSAS